jgi:hypothetical protein
MTARDKPRGDVAADQPGSTCKQDSQQQRASSAAGPLVVKGAAVPQLGKMP